MRIFFLMMFTLLLLLWSYVGLSLFLPWAVGTRWEGGVWIFLTGTFALQVWRWVFFESAEHHPRILLTAYFALGLFCYLMVAAAIKDLLGLIFEIPLWTYPGLIFASFALNIQSLFIALRGPQVKSVRIESKKAGRPLRIAQISDLHVGAIIQKPYVENVVNLIKGLQPDLIVATGDIGDGSAHILDEDLHPMRELALTAPCFYITGNHEYYWNAHEWIGRMKDLGFIALINQGQAVDLPGKIPLWLGGVPDLQAHRFIPEHKSDPHRAVNAELARDRFKVLLAHQPKSCFEAAKAGFELMLCGHTHGGQFFPFTLLVGLFNPYSRGLNQHQGMHVYVNVGTGYWGPPLRLGATSEITLIEIV